MGYGLTLAPALIVWHIDELEVMGKARIGAQEFRRSLDIGQVAQVIVAPVVQRCQAWPCAPLQQLSEQQVRLSVPKHGSFIVPIAARSRHLCRLSDNTLFRVIIPHLYIPA